MIVKHYLAIAERIDDKPWTVTFPSFPGLVATVFEFRDIARDAARVLAGAISNAQASPPAVEDGGPGPEDYPLDGFRDPRCFLIPVAAAGRETAPTMPEEIGGPAGPEPTRFGDWEQKGRATDF
jgi:hypothetical protein